jgi:hypothetical protein
MSFQKMDRNFQSKKGKSFHADSGQGEGLFAAAIAKAVLAEWGHAPSARKEVGRITRANERTVRNWFEGKNGPSGENLVALIRHSDEMLTMVLELSGRDELMSASSLLGLRPALVRAVNAIDRCQGRG